MPNVQHALRVVARTLHITAYSRTYVWMVENPVDQLQEMAIMHPYETCLQTTSYTASHFVKTLISGVM